MLKYGIISKFDATKGLAKVNFDGDEIESPWMAVLMRNTLKDKYTHHYDIGEHVACQMDEDCENGVILGAIYSKDEKPTATAAENVTEVAFESGPSFSWNRESKEFKGIIEEIDITINPEMVQIKHGDTDFTLTSAGWTIKRGGESLKKIIEDLIDAILAETHPTGTGPSGTPINAADYSAIKQRIPDLFEA